MKRICSCTHTGLVLCHLLEPERGAKLEQRLASVEETLQAEQVAHSKLQADATAERSQASRVKVSKLWDTSVGCCRSGHMSTEGTCVL